MIMPSATIANMLFMIEFMFIREQGIIRWLHTKANRVLLQQHKPQNQEGVTYGGSVLRSSQIFALCSSIPSPALCYPSHRAPLGGGLTAKGEPEPSAAASVPAVCPPACCPTCCPTCCPAAAPAAAATVVIAVAAEAETLEGVRAPSATDEEAGDRSLVVGGALTSTPGTVTERSPPHSHLQPANAHQVTSDTHDTLREQARDLLGHALRQHYVGALRREHLQLLRGLLHLRRRYRRAEAGLKPARHQSGALVNATSAQT